MQARVLVAALLCSSVGLAHAQTPDGPTSFEAVSIRPNRSGDPGVSIRRQPGGRFNTVNAPIRSLITLAFQIQGFQLVNDPDWISDDRFDIVAKMDGDPPPMPPGSPNDPMVLAVRAMLADRFKLATHRETREMDIYALVMARPDGKPGPALRPSTQDCPGALGARARGGAPPAPQPGGTQVLCGIRQSFGRVIAGGIPLSMFTNGLAGQLGRVVVDRTGLGGGWDFELTFAAEPPRGPLPPGIAPPPVDPDAPSLFTAIQEQLGLKLESTKGPVDVVVIDNVERPSPD